MQYGKSNLDTPHDAKHAHNHEEHTNYYKNKLQCKHIIEMNFVEFIANI
jgi:hypothetical protein